LSLPAVWAFIACATSTPAADFCCTVRVNRFTLSHDSVTCSRSPEVSSIAFHAQPLDLPPVPLMDVDFAIMCSLARHRRPHIQFLSIGSRVCSTLLSDLTSRFGPCALLSLRLHQAVKRAFTSKLSNMLGTHKKGAPFRAPLIAASDKSVYINQFSWLPTALPADPPKIPPQISASHPDHAKVLLAQPAMTRCRRGNASPHPANPAKNHP
jgi:hypothetical protein